MDGLGMKPVDGSVACLLVLLPVVGCAPLRLTEGVSYAADRYRVRDATALSVANRGHLRFNTALRSDLEDAIAATDLSEVKRQGIDALRRANALAIASASGEIDRMSGDGLAYLIQTYGLTEARAESAERREQVKRAFDVAARAAVKRDVATLSSAKDVREARRFLSSIHGKIEIAAGDRGKAARILLGAPLFIPASVGAQIADREAMQREVIADFKQVAEYRPAHREDVPGVAALEGADPTSLARWYAPVIVQQVDSGAGYPSSEDRIGRIQLTGTPDKIRVQVDISDPVVYWTRLEAKVGDRKYDQLVYVAWYPSRPALSANDPEAGRIDGVVVRITLDRHQRPAIYEFVRSCGCYHTLWVSEFVEVAARKQYGPPGKEQRFAVQRPFAGKELFFPDLYPGTMAHVRAARWCSFPRGIICSWV